MLSLHDFLTFGGPIRVDDIMSIGAPSKAHPDRVETCPVKLSDGRTGRVFEGEVEALMCRPVQLLPAEPGTQHIWAGVEKPEDGGEFWLMKTPVIAWALCVDGLVRFVTARGVSDGSLRRWRNFYVLMPDGSVQGVGDDYEHPFFPDCAAYRDHIIAQASAERASEKEAE